ncbi:MAG: hypothetical protein MMC33_010612 [Icmadophila ericetorum]|nr:hypothetical protein [Icmadophila ericetorum]
MSRNQPDAPLGEQSPLLPPPSEPSLDGVDHDHNASNQSVTPIRAFCIIASLGTLIFLQACNISGLTTAQSAIAESLDAYSETTWFVSAYLIAMASMSPLAGRLSQIFSPRNCVLVFALVFALGAFITSRANSLAVFLAGRAITGAGAAGILTLAIILVIELTTKRRRGLFIGLVNAGFTTGVSLGAVIAGALVGPLGWRFLFWIQTPFAVAAGLCIFFSIPKTFIAPDDSTGPEKQTIRRKLARVDYLGAILLTSSIVLLLVGLSSPKIQIAPILASIPILLIFILMETRFTSTPIIPVTVLKSRGALLTCFAQTGLMACRWTVLFYTPTYALAIRGWAPVSAGSILIPTNLGFGLGGVLAGWIHIRRTGSFYVACLATSALFPFTMVLLGYLSTSNPKASPALYFLATFLNGFLTGATLTYTLAHLLHLTPPSTHFISTSLLATFRGFAASFGSAIGGGAFTRFLQSSLQQGFASHGLTNKEDLIRRLLGSPVLVSSLIGVEHEVAIAGYGDSIRGLFYAAAGIGLLGTVLQAGAGWKEGVEAEKEEHREEEEVNGVA